MFWVDKELIGKEDTDFITLKKGDKLVRVHPSRVSHFLDRHYKIVNEKINEKEAGEPIVYVDMDGVLANFFEEWAKLAGIKSGNYKDIPPADIDPTLDKMIGTDFFAQLPKFPTADKLIQMVINFFGSYKILSSPLTSSLYCGLGLPIPTFPTDVILTCSLAGPLSEVVNTRDVGLLTCVNGPSAIALKSKVPLSEPRNKLSFPSFIFCSTIDRGL